MRALQVLEVALSSSHHAIGTRVGRSFFYKSNDYYDLGEGYEMYTGIYQAAILGEQPYLNVDIAHKSFPIGQTLLDYLRQRNIDPNMTMSESKRQDVSQFLKNLTISYEPPASFGSFTKIYKVSDVGDSAKRIKFTVESGEKVTVYEYYKSRNYNLKYPDLNCINTCSSTNNSISLPMELCSIVVGQKLNVSFFPFLFFLMGFFIIIIFL